MLDPVTTSGGGIVPSGKSRADERHRRLAALTGSALLKLPTPAIDRLILRMQRTARPPAEIVAHASRTEEHHGDVATTWLGPHPATEGAVVYLHGGGYVGGPAEGNWRWLSEIQRRTGLATAMVHYRMAPTDPFPAALDDALAAIRAMRTGGYLVEGNWLLAGDSAGGGLALAVAQGLRDEREPLPAGLMLTAPWVDIEMEHPDLLTHARDERLIGKPVLRWCAERYAGAVPLGDPRLSPINGSMGGLPPVHVNVGTRDLLLPDTRRLRVELEESGVQVTSIEQQDGTHTYPQLITTPEAEWTIRSQAAWISTRLESPTTSGAT